MTQIEAPLVDNDKILEIFDLVKKNNYKYYIRHYKKYIGYNIETQVWYTELVIEPETDSLVQIVYRDIPGQLFPDGTFIDNDTAIKKINNFEMLRDIYEKEELQR